MKESLSRGTLYGTSVEPSPRWSFAHSPNRGLIAVFEEIEIIGTVIH